MSNKAEGLTKNVDRLSGELQQADTSIKAEKARATNLEGKLQACQKTAADVESQLTRKNHELEAALDKSQSHDIEDHKALEEAHKTIQDSQVTRNALQKSLTQAEASLAAERVRAQEQAKRISTQMATISDLTGQLEVEREHNVELQKSLAERETKLKDAERGAAIAQKDLARTTEDLKEAKSESDDKDKIIDGLESGMMALKKDRDAKKKAYEDLKNKTDVSLDDLGEKLFGVSFGDIVSSATQGLGMGFDPVEFDKSTVESAVIKTDAKSALGTKTPTGIVPPFVTAINAQAPLTPTTQSGTKKA